MNSNKLSLEPRHLGVSFGVSKTISGPMVRLVQTVYLSCTYIAPALTLSPNGPKHDSIWPTLPRTSILCVQNIFCVYGSFGANSTPTLCQDQHYLQTRWNKLPLEPRHLGVPLGASKMISEPMVRLAQTMHLYCADTNTIYKRTEMRLHMTHSPRSSIGCIKINTISKRTQTSFHLSPIT
jgi:hypothetical protein